MDNSILVRFTYTARNGGKALGAAELPLKGAADSVIIAELKKKYPHYRDIALKEVGTGESKSIFKT